MGVDVSIVIPAFDEASRLPSTLRGLVADLPTWFGDRWEVVVVDDGSTDETRAVAEEAARRQPVMVIDHGRNLGKGAAMCSGVERSVGEFVVLLDADLPVEVATLHRLARCAEECDLVLGSRRLRGSSVVPSQPLARRLGARLFLAAVWALGYRSASDPQCGVKVLRRSTVAPVMAKVTAQRFAFDIELIERCRRAGLHAQEVPVAWRHVGGSSVRPLRDALVTLIDLAALRGSLGRGVGSGSTDP